MFFAAFEKKWWKSFIGDSTEANTNNNDLSSSELISSGSENLNEVQFLDREESDSSRNLNSSDIPSDEDFNSSITETVVLSKDTEDYFRNKEPRNNRRRNNRNTDDRGNRRNHRDSRRPSVSKEQDTDDNENEEIFSNVTDDFEQVDPLAPAFDLDGGGIMEIDYNELPKKIQKSDVSSLKDFFSTEILYRFDILPPSEKELLIGSYRIEVRGSQGGVWSLALTDSEIKVSQTREDADLVLMLHQEDLFGVVNGKINPQIALLSNRIKVSGSTRKASLLQNLLSPYPD